MRSCCLFCLLVTCLRGYAQDIVLKAPMNPSYSYMPYTLDTTDMEDGGSGPRQVWDFSNAHIADSGIMSHFAPIDNSPYQSIYPKANFAISNDRKTIISFLYGNEDMIALCGDVNFYNDAYVRKVERSGLDTQLRYPVYYGMSKWWSNKTYTTQRASDSSFAVSWLSKQSEADASGSLTAPDGRKYNVVRVVFKEYQSTKVYRMNDTGKVYWYHQVNNTVNTFWLCPEMPYLYLLYHSRSRVSIDGPGLRPVKYATREARFNRPVTTISMPDYNSSMLHVTRDLVSTVFVKYTTHQPEKGILQIIDMNGVTVFRTEAYSADYAPAENEQELNTWGLAPGMYIITYTSEKERGVAKWVKK